MSNLFVDKSFVSAAGLPLAFKIDCDALTDEDLACLAKQAAEAYQYEGSRISFHTVAGVPTGGLRFAAALEPYCLPPGKHVKYTLVVDDVYTTGTSINEFIKTREDMYIRGLVIFARGKHKLPDWIQPIFQLSPFMED